MFRPIFRPVLGERIIKRRLNSNEIESKMSCDKIYHSEKYKKIKEKLQDIETRMINNRINDSENHSEEYEKINKKLKVIDDEASWASFNVTLCLIVLLIKSY